MTRSPVSIILNNAADRIQKGAHASRSMRAAVMLCLSAAVDELTVVNPEAIVAEAFSKVVGQVTSPFDALERTQVVAAMWRAADATEATFNLGPNSFLVQAAHLSLLLDLKQYEEAFQAARRRYALKFDITEIAVAENAALMKVEAKFPNKDRTVARPSSELAHELLEAAWEGIR